MAKSPKEPFRVWKTHFTDRTADELAAIYGFEDLDRLVSDIPADANVLDAGSGASNFGHIVAGRRPDITWTNIDARYKGRIIPRLTFSERRWTYRSASNNAPPNLHMVGLNVMDLSRRYEEGQFDRVFSYWLLPWIMRQSRSRCSEAVGNLADVTNELGKLAVGPLSQVPEIGEYCKDEGGSSLTVIPRQEGLGRDDLVEAISCAIMTRKYPTDPFDPSIHAHPE